MNKSKRNLENDVDFISNMPDPILQLILQGLPNTEEVVRTSVLSTRWRYLWTSVPHFPSLDLDCDRLPNPSSVFPRKFVTWALADKTVDLDSFRVCCAGYFDSLTVEMWIKAAVNRNVKSLDLKYCPNTMYCAMYCELRDCIHNIVTKIELPDCLIECESLESLRLFLYQCPISLADCTGFAGLKVLELNKVYFHNIDAAEELLEKCALLEDLSLIDCSIRPDSICISLSKLKTLIIRNCKNVFWVGIIIEVSCPELVKFEYVGRESLLILDDVHSLKKAVIHHEDLLQKKNSPVLGRSISELLAGISHVDSLSLNLYFLPVDTSSLLSMLLHFFIYNYICNISNVK